jgi:hypothetical protein
MTDEAHPCTDDYWWRLHQRELAAAKKRQLGDTEQAPAPEGKPTEV